VLAKEGDLNGPARPWKRRDWMIFIPFAAALLGAMAGLTALARGPIFDWIGMPALPEYKIEALLAALFLGVVILFGNVRSRAYVFFWACGILLLDWLASVVSPGIRVWLDQVKSAWLSGQRWGGG
jgi:hypothetical protein